MQANPMFFILLVAGAVFVLSIALSTPVFGESKKNRAGLRKRLREIRAESPDSGGTQLLRDNYFNKLAPWERKLESIPALVNLISLIQQAGYSIPAYRVVILAGLLATTSFIGLYIFTKLWWAAAFAAAAGCSLPFFKLSSARNKRMEKFEESLPDALEIMKRALQAGHPLSETLQLVSKEMEGPVATEFGTTFADLNYGNNLRNALLGLLERMPSVTVMALITSIIVQKETGGNMAEIFSKLSKLIRGRYKFQRNIRTLSSEGRISAWVLCMVPFALFMIISITTPSYIPILFNDPLGQKLLIGSGIGMLCGIMLVRKIIRIEV